MQDMLVAALVGAIRAQADPGVRRALEIVSDAETQATIRTAAAAADHAHDMRDRRDKFFADLGHGLRLR